MAKVGEGTLCQSNIKCPANLRLNGSEHWLTRGLGFGISTVEGRQ
jgi:hypothetical protein